MSVTIVPDRDDLLTDYAVGMLKDFYLTSEETSPQEAYARAAEVLNLPTKVRWTRCSQTVCMSM